MRSVKLWAGTMMSFWLAMLSVTPAFAQTPVATPEPWFTPTFTETECAYPMPFGLEDDWSVYCGEVTVPMHYDGSTDEVATLPIVVLPSKTSRAAEEPILVLNGGPGQGLDASLMTFTDLLPWLTFLREGQDIVLFDQRGMGKSEPSLACPFETTDVRPNATPTDQPIASPSVLGPEVGTTEAMIDCKQSLEDQGIDLSVFNNRTNAADVNSIRIALDLDQIDLYGVSYGSKLALTVIRDYPEIVHSAILASALPLEADPFVEQYGSFDAALRNVFTACEQDATCAAQNPDLEAKLVTLIDRLNEQPETVVTADLFGDPQTITLDGKGMLQAIYVTVFSGGLLANSIPQMITAGTNGDFELAAMLASMASSTQGITVGATLAFNCQDEYPYTSQQALDQYLQDHDLLAPIEDGSFEGLGALLSPVCEAWDLPADDPIGNDPVVSDVPTLIISGAIDPVTPNAYADMIDANFSNATVIDLVSGGHDPIPFGGDCTWLGMEAFIDDPAAVIDTSCGNDEPLDFEDTLADDLNTLLEEESASPEASPAATPID